MSKTCKKCGRSYKGWRCPHCYRGKNRAGRSNRARGHHCAADVLMRGTGMPVGHSYSCDQSNWFPRTWKFVNEECQRNGWDVWKLPREKLDALLKDAAKAVTS
jgi:hypothetical protein